ncbi:peptidase S41 family protein [Xylariaceae sp. FL0662B]|nr:peptidase S41 family protein [Xylariaceae sp. FL0662B]
MYYYYLWFLVSLIVSVSAGPAPQVSTPATRSNGSACAQVSRATAALLASSPSAQPFVPASIAFDCLKSVPNKPQPAQKLVTSVKALVQWQSTLAWLKDPPQSYMLPPVDIEGALDNISATAVAGGFASEYDFQLAIFELITSAHDGHFAYRPDVFKAFTFQSKLASDIVSVSKDGKEVPKLYHASALASNATPVAISKINGQDAVKYITKQGLKFSAFQDPNSQWNNQFPIYANPENTLVLAASLAYQGPSVTLTYEDGKEKTEDTVAVLREGADFSDVATGEDFYNKFCNPDAASTGDASSSAPPTQSSTAAPTPPAPTIQGYPFPVVRDSGADTTSGYFLNGTGYDDVAVLSVISFAPTGNVDVLEYITNFQETVETFLSKSKEAGKKRLVIDVTANGGGLVVAGLELFAQLFPDTERFGANNLRLSDGLVNIAQVASSIPQDFTPSTQNEALALQALFSNSIVSNLVPGQVATPEDEPFTTTDEILSPVTIKNDKFTAYQNAPMDMPASDFNLTGTGSRANPAPAVFSPENVVLLTDGTCGSTCTIFSYLMILQLQVKTTAVGGRPQTGPMQAVAGVEGAQVFMMNEITTAAAAALALAPQEQQAQLQASELGVLAEGYAIQRAADPAQAGAVNAKNAFAPFDSKTPLQFLYQSANCRFFYTADMLDGPALVWQRAVDATWNDPANFCVQGSRVAMNASRTLDPAFRLKLDDDDGDGTAAAAGSQAGETGAPVQSLAAGRIGELRGMQGAIALFAAISVMLVHL